MSIRQTKNIAFILFIAFLFGIDPFVYAQRQSDIDREEAKKIPRITARNAYILFQQNKIIIFDVHPSANKRASVLGAHYLDGKKIDKIKLKLPKNQLIGVY